MEILSTVRYMPRVTSLRNGTCNNVDYMVLLLGTKGPMRAKDVHAAFAAWRGRPLSRSGQFNPINTLLQLEYGRVSHSFSDLSRLLFAPFYGFGNAPCTLWYRVSRGVYALNANGMARLAAVLAN